MGEPHDRPTYPKPGPEHERLRSLTGVWTARILAWPTLGGDPVESTGELQTRMDLGGYFLSREMNFGLQGFQGRGITGFDPRRGVYVGTWADSRSPLLHPTEGHFDDNGVFHERTHGSYPDGTPFQMRMTTTILGKTKMLYEMRLVQDDGEEILILRIEHTRRTFGR